MMNQPMSGKSIDGQSVVDGTAVFDLAGENVGTAVQLYPPVDCLVVQKGWFAHERYVPFSLVVSQDDRGLFLNVSKQELKDDRWNVPPPGSEMAAAANPSVIGGSQRGVEDPSAATASPPRDSLVSAPPVESVVRADGQPVDGQGEIEDEQRVAVVLVPDAPGAVVDEVSQSDAALSAGEQPLQTAEAETQQSKAERSAQGREAISGGTFSQGVAVIEATPHTRTQGRSVLEQSPHTDSTGTASIEQRPDTVTLGTDTIAPRRNV